MRSCVTINLVQLTTYNLVWKLDEPHNMVSKFKLCQTFHALNILRMTDDAIDIRCMKICVLRGIHKIQIRIVEILKNKPCCILLHYNFTQPILSSN